jgi:hypothetical protein
MEMGRIQEGDAIAAPHGSSSTTIRCVSQRGDAPTVFVRIFTHGSFLDVTPDHYVPTASRGLVKAQHVTTDDSLVIASTLQPTRVMSTTTVTSRGYVNAYPSEGAHLVVNGLVASPLCDDMGWGPARVPVAACSIVTRAVAAARAAGCIVSA